MEDDKKQHYIYLSSQVPGKYAGKNKSDGERINRLIEIARQEWIKKCLDTIDEYLRKEL